MSGPHVIQERPYQEAAREAVFAKFRTHDSTLVVMATGAGKSAVGAAVARDFPRGRRVLVLAHRVEILRQWRDTLLAVCPGDHVELEADGCHATPADEGGLFGAGRIVVASKDALFPWRRLRRFRREEFGLVIVDEAHHASVCAKTYARVLDHFNPCKRLGLTATADRLDGVSLAPYFRSVAYTYDTLRCMQDGWLVPAQQVLETVTGWELDDVPSGADGDFHPEALNKRAQEKKPLLALRDAARKWANHGGQRRPCLIFACSVQHAQKVADLLNDDELGCAVALDGGTDPTLRAAERERFRRGEFQFLVGCGLYDEGFDEPSIKVVVIGRPTKSRARYAQMFGRALRLWADAVPEVNAAPDASARAAVIRRSPKPSAVVVDLVGVSSRLKLATSIDVLGGSFPQPVRDLAFDAVRSSGGRMEVTAALEKARQKFAEQERAERKKQLFRARLESREIDPFDLLDIRPTRAPLALRKRQASDGQLRFLRSCGVRVPDELSFWDAKALCDAAAQRRDAGPPSPKMASLLAKFGFPAERMNYSEAKAAIDLLASQGWTRDASGKAVG